MQELRKKQKIYLNILFLIALLITADVIVAIIYINHMIISTIVILLLIVLLLLIYYFKSKYDFYATRYQYAKLISVAEEPLSIRKTTDPNALAKQLEKNGYEIYTKNGEYIFLYKITNRKKKRKHRILYAALIFINMELSFDDAITNNFFASLEDATHKKEKYMQRIFYQIKINDKDPIESANNNLFVSSRQENYIFINVLFNNSKLQMYYLHSNEFSPNRYYTLASEELQNVFIGNVKPIV